LPLAGKFRQFSDAQIRDELAHPPASPAKIHAPVLNRPLTALPRCFRCYLQEIISGRSPIPAGILEMRRRRTQGTAAIKQADRDLVRSDASADRRNT
jgi:hypothetical protein